MVGQGSSLGLTAVPIWIQDFIARESSRVRVWGWRCRGGVALVS